MRAESDVGRLGCCEREVYLSAEVSLQLLNLSLQSRVLIESCHKLLAKKSKSLIALWGIHPAALVAHLLATVTLLQLRAQPHVLLHFDRQLFQQRLLGCYYIITT